MNDVIVTAFGEEELDALVSIAIRRAEVLDEMGSSSASEAWREVMAYEERLAAMTDPSDIPGGVARVGAVRAALAAGLRQEAARLASEYRAEDSLPLERRKAIEQAFEESRERLASRYPTLAKSGRLAELDQWRATFSAMPRVFPCPA